MDKEDLSLKAICAVWCGHTNSDRPNLQLYAETETLALDGGDAHDNMVTTQHKTGNFTWKQKILCC